MAKLHDRLLQLTRDGVCRFTLAKGRILLANEGLTALVGYDRGPEDLEGRSLDDLMPPLSGPKLRDCLGNEKHPPPFEHAFRDLAGDEKRVIVHATVVSDRKLHEKVVEAIFQEVTAPETEPDEVLRTHETWLRCLVEHAAEILYVHDPAGQLLEVNRRACQMLGYTKDELLTKNVSDLIAGFQQESHAALWAKTQANGMATIEVYHQRKDGTRFPAEARLTVLESGARPLMLALARDVTKRKQTEEEVRRLNAELSRRVEERTSQLASASQERDQELSARKRAEEAWREQSRFLSVLLETVPVPIFFKDAAGHYLGCNRAFEELAGLSRREIEGQTVHDVATPELAAVYEKADRELMEQRGAQRYESQLTAADGSTRDVVFHKAVLTRSDGAPGGLVGAIMDVTERRRSEREIRALNEDLRLHAAELETANRDLQTFSYSVSHDLRAPLRAMNGFAEALEEDFASELSEEVKAYLQRIRASAKRMDDLIEDLLKLSRVVRADLHREPVDLSSIAAAVADELRQTAPDRPVDLTIAPGLACEGDPNLLRIVMENLLGNAWKFATGPSSTRIEFGFENTDNAAAFYVRDNGVGFDMAYARKLFVPFQRLHTSAEFPGNGIGLATVQRIIGRHGGRVWAEGRPDEGATFYFTVGRNPNS